jgi:hypothetical protein
MAGDGSAGGQLGGALEAEAMRLRREVFDLRLSLTGEAKQLVYDYIRARVEAGECSESAVVVSVGGQGKKHPHVDLQYLGAEDLRKVASLILSAS